MNGLIEVKPQKKTDPSEYGRINKVPFYPPFCRPFRCWQSCHGDENCLLFSSLFVEIIFFETCSIQLIFIMIVDFGTILLHLKSTVNCNSFH